MAATVEDLENLVAEIRQQQYELQSSLKLQANAVDASGQGPAIQDQANQAMTDAQGALTELDSVLTINDANQLSQASSQGNSALNGLKAVIARINAVAIPGQGLFGRLLASVPSPVASALTNASQGEMAVVAKAGQTVAGAAQNAALAAKLSPWLLYAGVAVVAYAFLAPWLSTNAGIAGMLKPRRNGRRRR